MARMGASRRENVSVLEFSSCLFGGCELRLVGRLGILSCSRRLLRSSRALCARTSCSAVSALRCGHWSRTARGLFADSRNFTSGLSGRCSGRCGSRSGVGRSGFMGARAQLPMWEERVGRLAVEVDHVGLEVNTEKKMIKQRMGTKWWFAKVRTPVILKWLQLSLFSRIQKKADRKRIRIGVVPVITY